MKTSFDPDRRVRRGTRAAIFAGMVTSLAAAAPASATDGGIGPPIETFRLDNGMEVIVITDRRAPVVTHMVWYRAGAADEPVGKSGIAHFLEHLMFKGSEDIPSGEFSKIVARNGGQDNAFTSQDYTAYYQRVARDRLPLVMQMEAGRVNDLVLNDGEVRSERDVVLEERAGRIENRPLSVLGEKMIAALYGDHPYAVTVIGHADEIRSLGITDAFAFYRRFYAPDNAALVVAGDISAAELKPLAEKFYGVLPPHREGVERVHLADAAPPDGPIHLRHADERVIQRELQRLYLADSYASSDIRTATAINLLAYILGGDSTGRLYRDLVVDQALASHAGAWSVTELRAQGRIGLQATPRDGIAMDELEPAIDEVVERLVREGISAEELDRAKNNLIARYIYSSDDQQTIAHTHGVAWITGFSPDQVTGWPDVVRSMTSEEVNGAAKTYLDARRSVTGYLVPGDDS